MYWNLYAIFLMQAKELHTRMRLSTWVVALAMLAAPVAAFGQAAPGDGGPADTNQDRPYFEFQVEKPAMARAGNPHPEYPPSLEKRGINGRVLAQFVVDTLGRPVPSTFRVVTSSDAAFTVAVEEVLPRMRFYPAEISGRKVKQLVQQSFLFLAKKR